MRARLDALGVMYQTEDCRPAVFSDCRVAILEPIITQKLRNALRRPASCARRPRRIVYGFGSGRDPAAYR